MNARTEITKKYKGVVMGSADKTNEEISTETGLTAKKVQRMRSGTRHKTDSSECAYARGVKAEERLSAILTENGICHTLMPNHHPFDILLADGRRLEVKSRETSYYPPSLNKRVPGVESQTYWMFNTGMKKRGDYADFFALYIVPLDTFFILPLVETKESTLIVWPTRSKKTKYEKYANAFDVLKTPS